MNWILHFLDSIGEAMPALMLGAVVTIEITTLSVFFGLLLGLVFGMGRLSGWKLTRGLSTAYVDFLRGTPLLVQIFIIYFGVPALINQITGGRHPISPFVAAVIACSINSGAYIAEIVRAGIQSIERGQMEAARSLGMTHWQAMKLVILPQAVKRIIPPLGNEFIAMLKDTSLLSVIGFEELTRKGQLVVAATYDPFPIWTGIAFVYLAMTMVISRLVAYSEKRLRQGDHRPFSA
jgi:glutamine transport system permease protein